MDTTALQANAADAAALLKALANPARLMVLCTLVEGEHTAGELEAIAGLSQSALSQHLARLRREGMVKTRRDKQAIIYRLANPQVTRVLETLYAIYCADEDRHRRHLKDHAEH